MARTALRARLEEDVQEVIPQTWKLTPYQGGGSRLHWRVERETGVFTNLRDASAKVY